MKKELHFSTMERYEFLDITSSVKEVIRESGVKEGMVLVFSLHSTAAIMIAENEGGLLKDFNKFFNEIVPDADFLHDKIDNNTDSHILASIVGQGECLPIGEGKLEQGTWQSIFLAEFDGPRKRKVLIKVIT